MIKVRPRVKKVDFQFYAPDASSVVVVGEFNGWQPIPMNKARKGMWKLTLDVPPGTYQFRYLVDNHYWANDESTPTVPNPFGTENSVVEVPETKSKTKAKTTTTRKRRKKTAQAKETGEEKPKRRRGRPRKKAE